jgi:hypothetical protein
MSTTPSIQNGTRGSAFSFQDFAITNESITISTYRELGVYIDRADLAQSGFATQMELADRQGQLMNEKIESAMLASHADWTNVGDTGGVITSGVTTAITVSASNIDDIIRGIKRIIRVANGKSQMAQNGVFVIWRPEDFELLESFVQANGFSTADSALKDGTLEGFRYMGVDHYYSNDYTAGHLFAGVKKQYHLGICRSTWGQISILQNPTGLVTGTTWGNLSGIGIHIRADFAFKAWTSIAGLIYDLNVA